MDYRAWRAHQHAYVAARRPKVAKLAHRPLAKQVSTWLSTWWSPDQIAKRLRIEFPDDPMMWVSHETIYQSLFVQGRGELRRELARCLRSGQVQRRRKDRYRPKGELPNMVTISDRPPEVEDRAVPGHWEGDLICGSHNRSAVGTLVERQTRYVMLLHLPDSHEATAVQTAMEKAIKTMPAALFKTLTWDRGKEMARHVDIKVSTGVQVYFCDPHSPLATRLEREYQWASPPVPTQGNQSLQLQRERSDPDRSAAQRTASQDPRIYETIGETRRARCDDCLNPPN